VETITDIMDGSRILEIASDTSEFNIDNDPRVNIQELTKDDPSPMFVNVEVLRTGTSKVNRRVYDDPVVRQIGGMIPGTIGYLGHPDPTKTSFQFRDPQNIFVGSKVEEMKDGSTRAIGKAYIFKNSPLREWLPKSIAGGKPLTVSINGIGDIVKDNINKLLYVKSLNQLDSIDWANPGTEGVGTAQAINIVNEMQDNKGGGSSMSEVITRTPELIRSVTIAELKAYNDTAIDGIVRGMTISELQEKNPTLFNTIKDSGKISDIKLNLDGKETQVKLTEMQGVIDAKDAKIAELQGQIESVKITEYANKKLTELGVPDQFREKISKRITGKTEADIDKSITAEIGYIKEMVGDTGFDNPPRGNTIKTNIGDDLKAQVRSLFHVKEDKTK